MENHHLLQTKDEGCWQTFRGGRYVPVALVFRRSEADCAGGSRVYVEQIMSLLNPSRVHLNTAVHSVSSFPVGDPSSPAPQYKILLETASGKIEEFDHVIMACHTDTTLDILRRGAGMTEQEEKLLNGFSWNKNTAVLHSDPRVCRLNSCAPVTCSCVLVQLMPKSPEAWSCWNYLTYSAQDRNTGVRKANINRTSW